MRRGGEREKKYPLLLCDEMQVNIGIYYLPLDVADGSQSQPSMEVESGASLDSGYPQSMEMESCEQR